MAEAMGVSKMCIRDRYRWFGLGLDQTGKRNWELGLDE